MRSAAPTIRYLSRVVIFTASVTLFLGWLAAPEMLRAGRDAAAGYIPLPLEATSPQVFPDATARPTPEGGATALALAALLVLTFGFGMPRGPVDRGAVSGARMFERPARRVRKVLASVPSPVTIPAAGGRRVSVSLVFVLALGLFLGWMSAPDFVRHHEVSVAALRTAADEDDRKGGSSHLMDGFSSWMGPTNAGSGSKPFGEVPLALLEAVPQTTDLLEFEVFEDAETLLAEIEESDPPQAALLADEMHVASAGVSSGERAEAPERTEVSPRGTAAVPAGTTDADGGVFLASSGPAASSTATAGGDSSGTGAADGGANTQTASVGNGSGAGEGGGSGSGPGQDGNDSTDDGDRDGGRGRADPIPQFVLGEVLVRFEDAAEGTAIADLLDAIAGEISQCFDVIDDCVVKVSTALDPRQLAEDLRGQPTVASATPNWIRMPATTPQDTLFPLQWSLRDLLGLHDIGAVGAWAAMGDVRGKVRVAILDTAVDTLHPDLSDVVERSQTVSRGIGSLPDHGTNVAGILAAQGDSFGISGVNRSWAELYVFDVFSTLTVGPTIGDLIRVVGAKDSVIIEAIDRLPALGIRVANLSFAGGPPSDPLCGALASASNVLFVAAAGNSGSPSESVYPANCPGDNVIAVASLDRTGRLAVTSNHGNWVEIAAPGELILTTAPGASYVANSGTSMAAPHVAGVASMMFAKNSGYDPATVRNLLMSRSVDAGKLGIRGGRLNACRALGGSDC